jgi:hypothetical protein
MGASPYDGWVNRSPPAPLDDHELSRNKKSKQRQCRNAGKSLPRRILGVKHLVFNCAAAVNGISLLELRRGRFGFARSVVENSQKESAYIRRFPRAPPDASYPSDLGYLDLTSANPRHAEFPFPLWGEKGKIFSAMSPALACQPILPIPAKSSYLSGGSQSCSSSTSAALVVTAMA